MPEAFKALDDTRAERFRTLVEELIPKIQQVSPELSEAQLESAARLMAKYRLADGALSATSEERLRRFEWRGGIALPFVTFGINQRGCRSRRE